MSENKEQELLDNLFQELRRGTIILIVLSQLEQPQYGYSLVVLLEEKGMAVDAGTLYPLLRRLEKQELLISSWDTEGSKPRKYYQLSELGIKIYNQLCLQWNDLANTMNKFIGGVD
ncbi:MULTISPECIES: PadR family transcriptional regulator [Bacillus]|uniref:PadR family transcriptional regulator n=1 Tax=Bacillus TaxID=1386 RepID=UPI0002F425E9|nr:MULTISPECIES: PadR family transcriptional regulator [Bacillus]